MMRLTIVLVACISISFYTLHVIDDNTDQKLSDHSGTVVQGFKTSQSRDISSLLENYLKIAQSHNTKSVKASPVHHKLNACASKGKHKPPSNQPANTTHPGRYESDDEDDYSPLVGVTPIDHHSHSDDDVIYYNDRSAVGSMEGHNPLSVQISCIAHSNSGDDSAIYYNDRHVSESNGKHYPPSDKQGIYTSPVCASKGKHKPPSNTAHPGPYESDDEDGYILLVGVTPINHHSHSDDDVIYYNDRSAVGSMEGHKPLSVQISCTAHSNSGDDSAIYYNDRHVSESLVCASKGKHKSPSDQAANATHTGPYESDDEEDYSPLVGVTPINHHSHSDDDVIYYNDSSVIVPMKKPNPLPAPIIPHFNSGDDDARGRTVPRFQPPQLLHTPVQILCRNKQTQQI